MWTIIHDVEIFIHMTTFKKKMSMSFPHTVITFITVQHKATLRSTHVEIFDPKWDDHSQNIQVHPQIQSKWNRNVASYNTRCCGTQNETGQLVEKKNMRRSFQQLRFCCWSIKMSWWEISPWYKKKYDLWHHRLIDFTFHHNISIILYSNRLAMCFNCVS